MNTCTLLKGLQIRIRSPLELRVSSSAVYSTPGAMRKGLNSLEWESVCRMCVLYIYIYFYIQIYVCLYIYIHSYTYTFIYIYRDPYLRSPGENVEAHVEPCLSLKGEGLRRGRAGLDRRGWLGFSGFRVSSLTLAQGRQGST